MNQFNQDFAEIMKSVKVIKKMPDGNKVSEKDRGNETRKVDIALKKTEDKPDISVILNEGRSAGKNIRIDNDQFRKGMESEKEHTSNYDIRKKIVTDHILENPKYYTWLAWMENLSDKYDTPKDYEDSRQ